MHNLLSLVLSKILFYDHVRSAMLIVLNVDVTMTSYSSPLFKNPHCLWTQETEETELKPILSALCPCNSQLGAPVGLKQEPNACHWIFNFF